MKKKIFTTIFLIFILLANVSLASYNTVIMSIAEEPICTIDIENNSKFEKKIISKDLNNKEVTIQLQVTNGEASLKPTGELVLVLDNSSSMEEKTSDGKIRKDLVFDSAKYLINTILADNDELKLAIVTFSSNKSISKEGTIEDALVISELTNNVTDLNNAISNIEANGARTDLDAGLKLASEQFSSEQNNKYMIVLTDGIPNIAVNYDKKYFSDDVILKTKEELQTIQQKGINIITMLTGITKEDSTPGSSGQTKTFKEIITEIFGTQTEPTAGKFYYITDDKIEQTITNEIYNSLMPNERSYKDITIVDYFPDEIIKNFDFSYVSQANIGNISAKVDSNNNSITWSIPELASGQTAIVQYKLKLKENFDSNIVNKILNTNKKVDITYTDFNEKQQSKTSDISPKLKLAEPPVVLPKAGVITLISLGILVIGFATFSIIRLTGLNNKMKQ